MSSFLVLSSSPRRHHAHSAPGGFLIYSHSLASASLPVVFLMLPPPDSGFSSLHLPNLDACSKILLDSGAGVTFDSAAPLAHWVPLIAPSRAGVFQACIARICTNTHQPSFGISLVTLGKGYTVIEKKKKGSFTPCPIESEPANLDSFSTKLLFSSLPTGSVNCILNDVRRPPQRFLGQQR